MRQVFCWKITESIANLLTDADQAVHVSIIMAAMQAKVSKDLLLERINLAKRLRTLNIFIEELFDNPVTDGSGKASKTSGLIFFLLLKYNLN